MNPSTFIFFGPSGSGKGTQAKLLMDVLKEKDPERKVLYLETGSIFRKFAEGDSLTAQKVKKVLAEGGLMPEFLPVWIWSQYFIDNIVTGDEHIVLDGVSRREHEALIIDSAMKFYERKGPVVISLRVSPSWATERMESRNRSDDNAKEIASRLEWYEKNVVPALKHFRENPHYIFFEINGEQSIEDVHKEILSKIGL